MTKRSVGLMPKGNSKFVGKLQASLLTIGAILETYTHSVFAFSDAYMFKDAGLTQPLTVLDDTYGTYYLKPYKGTGVLKVTPTGSFLMNAKGNTWVYSHSRDSSNIGSTYYESISLTTNLVTNPRFVACFDTAELTPSEASVIQQWVDNNPFGHTQLVFSPLDISSMFTSSTTHGAYYTATDPSSFFRYKDMETPSYNGQAVYVILDRARPNLLPEKLLNVTYENGLEGTVTSHASQIPPSEYALNTENPLSGLQDAKLTVHSPYTNRPIMQIPSSAQAANRIYKLGFDYRTGPEGIKIHSTNVAGSVDNRLDVLTGEGRKEYTILGIAAGERAYLYFGDVVGSVQLDNITLEQYEGVPIYQSTSASRPLFKNGEFTFDNVDDVMIHSAASSPLTNCTIVRSSREEGVVIQTGVHITSSHAIRETFCDYLLINRSLTKLERDKIVYHFNKTIQDLNNA